MKPLDELAHLLKPAGGGLYLVSTGKAAQEALQQRLYSASSVEQVAERFRESLARIASAKAVVLGIPSDVGAGFRRGANLGPQAMRTRLLEELPTYPERAKELGIVDIGDVFVVPQLLHDDMLSESQRAASHAALYPGVSERLPVSPLSIAERALDLVFQINPKVAPIVLGGDHSNAWPVSAALSRARKNERWGIVQPDAHTDLLETRLGIKYCFATWSFHANALLGGEGRMVQVGTRASRFPQEHWEKLGVRQFWAKDINANPDAAVDAIVQHLVDRKVTGVYFSNDIDGTDEKWASATGTPEPDGVTPEFLVALIRRLGETVGLIAGDIMEVAPPLGAPGDPTVDLAVRYLRETMSAILKAKV